MEEQSVFWLYEHKQFSKGKFQGRIVAVHTEQLQLNFSFRSTGIITRGNIPAGTTILTLPISMEHSLYYRGRSLADYEVIALNSNEEFELQTSLALSVITVAVNSDLLERQCRELFLRVPCNGVSFILVAFLLSTSKCLMNYLLQPKIEQ